MKKDQTNKIIAKAWNLQVIQKYLLHVKIAMLNLWQKNFIVGEQQDMIIYFNLRFFLENVPNFKSFWENLFLVKTAQKVRDLGKDYPEFCVLFSVDKSILIIDSF